jgi:hypothetical protein
MNERFAHLVFFLAYGFRTDVRSKFLAESHVFLVGSLARLASWPCLAHPAACILEDQSRQ